MQTDVYTWISLSTKLVNVMVAAVIITVVIGSHCYHCRCCCRRHQAVTADNFADAAAANIAAANIVAATTAAAAAAVSFADSYS